MERVVRTLTRLAAGLLVIVVMAGPVVAVASAAGNPFPTDLLDRLASRTIDDATIVKLLSLGFYVCWAWFCGPALRQLWTATGRRRRFRDPETTAPRGPLPSPTVEPLAGPRGWLAGVARFAVTGAIAASTVAAIPPPPSAAAPTPASTPVVATLAAGPGTATVATPAAEVTSVETSHRDTPYAIARRYFPPERVDAAREAIVELNVGRSMPDGAPYRGGSFPIGWNVIIPAVPVSVSAVDGDPSGRPTVPGVALPGAAGDDLRNATSVTAGTTRDEGNALVASPGSPAHDVLDTPQTVDVESSATTVAVLDAPIVAEPMIMVVDGDNLWDLSVARHEQAGVAPAPSVIAAYVAEVAAINQIADPNLIYTGQRLVMPAIDADPADTPISPAAATPDGMEPVIHVFERGDTMWDVLEAYHGRVDAEMVREVAGRNGIEDPSNIAVGTAVTIAWRPVVPAPPEPAPTAAPEPSAVPDAPPAP
ncbi:MAG TPA: LysM domain-containing protein, partial [Ilumatobacteraceae bacterium]|nr:LysM domain-containing protein [Ilumatobacteraceae bacterium]